MNSFLGNVLIFGISLLPAALVVAAVVKRKNWKETLGVDRKYDFIRVD
jgi:hypothetical protein